MHLFNVEIEKIKLKKFLGDKMKIQNKEHLVEIIKNDAYMMEVLLDAAQLNLPDWWISAGFVRNKVWDIIHDYEETPLNDVDVIYYEPDLISVEREIEYDAQLNIINPNIPWASKNQTRMHKKNNFLPYKNSIDAVNKYPEMPTAICVTLREGNVILHYDYPFEELVEGIVKPTPFYDKDSKNHYIYQQRIIQKNWIKTWPKLKIER